MKIFTAVLAQILWIIDGVRARAAGTANAELILEYDRGG